MAVDSHLGYYRNRSVIERLRADVVLPARAAGYTTIWLVGTSLGGVGSLFYLRDHPQDLAGVLALAPFLGQPEVIAEIAAGGGPGRWQPPASLPPDDVGRELWSWLTPWLRGPQSVPLHLGWGIRDALDPGNRLLAGALSPARVYTVDGGHDWATWARLWAAFLDRSPPCVAEAPAASNPALGPAPTPGS